MMVLAYIISCMGEAYAIHTIECQTVAQIIFCH